MTHIEALIIIIGNGAICWIAWRAGKRADRAERKCDILQEMMAKKDMIDQLQKERLDRIQLFLNEMRVLLQNRKT